MGYHGLYSTLNQSADKMQNGRLAKRGGKLTKKAIYLAFTSAIKHNDKIRTVYLKYCAKGCAKKEALIIVVRENSLLSFNLYT